MQFYHPFSPEIIESAPGRANVLLRIEGEDASRGALVLHGHTDVVPAEASDWSVDPFAAEIIDGMVWGRGAVDMKDMDAMILAVVRSMGRDGWRPLDPSTARVGQRVRRVADSIEGTLSAWLMLDGETLARVVFTGHRNSWVDLISINQLEMA